MSELPLILLIAIIYIIGGIAFTHMLMIGEELAISVREITGAPKANRLTGDRIAIIATVIAWIPIYLWIASDAIRDYGNES